MTELIWPPSLRVSSAEWSLIGNAGESRSPLNGVGQTIDRSGDRWKVTLNVENASDRATVAERSIAEAFLASIRNKNNRVWVTPPGYAPRGSFPATELFTNADFSNGTTGWSTYNSTLAVNDRVLRATSTGATNDFGVSRATDAVIGVPYVLRAAFVGSHTHVPQISVELGAQVQRAEYSGMVASSFVAHTTTPTAFAFHSQDGGDRASRYLDLGSISLARCALVDNGPNALLYSDQIDNAAWTKANVTITANGATAPDGTTTADAIVENSATAQHYVLQSVARASAAEDICAYGYFKRGAGARNIRLIAGDSSLSNYGQAYFDLGAGTVSAGSISGSATNPRAFIRAAGDGWYFCSVVARLPTSTGLTHYAELADGTTTGYAGDGTSSVYAWRLGAARSGVPTRGAQTVATALASGTTQTGRGLYLKGLPASTLNLAYAGEWCQIGSQLFKLTSAFDSDAAGLGFLQVSPNIRTPFADNEPVIFNQPMAKMRLATEEMSWSLHPGGFGTFQLTFEESL